eukprot:TRINITY_DN2360_c0_g1_i1.p1 TRINITY_DN2360_c0_g1~~TRINITY_DN2360_c0_g1_i1.p1  ORF type:complete len:696 (+),score=185.60 TRINITY_DN2360_c0_g1_i1:282-2090(+)
MALDKAVNPTASHPIERSTEEKPKTVEKKDNDDFRSTPANKNTPESSKKTSSYSSNKRDSVDQFMELLTTSGIGSSCTWEQALRIIITDPRYRTLKTLTERKQVFSDYISEKKKQEREEIRTKERKARDEFMRMLKECDQINLHSSLKKSLPLIEKDDRYQAIDSEGEREELYEDYLYELEKKQKEEQRQARKENMRKFKEMLETLPEYNGYNVRIHWRELKEQLKEDSVFKALERMDRLTVFQEHIRHQERKEAEEKRVERDKLRRQCRKNRDAFRALIAQKYSDGEFDFKSKWKDVLALVKENPAFQSVLQQPGSNPSELFMDFKEELDEQYLRERRNLKEILKGLTDVEIKSSTTFEEFESNFRADPKYENIDTTFRKLYFDEVKEKVIRKEKSEDKKKKKKSLDAFQQVLKKTRSINSFSTWSLVRDELASDSSYQSLTDEEREAAFKDYIASLNSANDASDEEGRIRDETPEQRKSSKDKEKKRHRSRNHASSDEDPKSSKKKHKKRHRKSKHHSRSSSDSEDEKRTKRVKSKSSSSGSTGTGQNQGSSYNNVPPPQPQTPQGTSDSLNAPSPPEEGPQEPQPQQPPVGLPEKPTSD